MGINKCMQFSFINSYLSNKSTINKVFHVLYARSEGPFMAARFTPVEPLLAARFGSTRTTFGRVGPRLANMVCHDSTT